VFRVLWKINFYILINCHVFIFFSPLPLDLGVLVVDELRLVSDVLELVA
jgi:hypothetical protein